MNNACKNWSTWLKKTRFSYMTEEQIEQTLNWLSTIKDQVLLLADIKKGQKVADFGCGSGLLGFGVLEKFGNDVELIFSDKFQDCLDECSKILAQSNEAHNAKFLLSDVANIKLDSNYLDCAMTRSVLVHVKEKLPAFAEFYRILKNDGSFFFHLDYREIHYCKVMLDGIFGRDSFINEIIWSYDYGARSKKKWSCKHDTILWYAKDPENYTFNYDAIDRIPYLAPSLCGAEKAERGKTPTDVWWNTIVSPNGKEKTGYATQKPLNIMNRIVQVHSNENDYCLDFFAGSGSFGEACKLNNRNCDLVDVNPDAIAVMKKRLSA